MCVHALAWVLMCPSWIQECVCAGENVHMSVCQCRSYMSAWVSRLGSCSLGFLRQGHSLAKISLNRQALGIQPPPPSTGTTNSPHNTQHPDFCTLMTELPPQPKRVFFLHVKLTDFHRKSIIMWLVENPYVLVQSLTVHKLCGSSHFHISLQSKRQLCVSTRTAFFSNKNGKDKSF